MNRFSLHIVMIGIALTSSTHSFAGKKQTLVIEDHFKDIGTPTHNAITRVRKLAHLLVNKATKKPLSQASLKGDEKLLTDALLKLKQQTSRMTGAQKVAFNSVAQKLERDHVTLSQYPNPLEVLKFYTHFIEVADEMHLKELAKTSPSPHEFLLPTIYSPSEDDDVMSVSDMSNASTDSTVSRFNYRGSDRFALPKVQSKFTGEIKKSPLGKRISVVSLARLELSTANDKKISFPSAKLAEPSKGTSSRLAE